MSRSSLPSPFTSHPPLPRTASPASSLFDSPRIRNPSLPSSALTCTTAPSSSPPNTTQAPPVFPTLGAPSTTSPTSSPFMSPAHATENPSWSPASAPRITNPSVPSPFSRSPSAMLSLKFARPYTTNTSPAVLLPSDCMYGAPRTMSSNPSPFTSPAPSTSNPVLLYVRAPTISNPLLPSSAPTLSPPGCPFADPKMTYALPDGEAK
mmetsp:Transcript_61172/g.126312  ORF Transcript_61172/g.126312 Transcript_61172/m.126312 type:complete len:207 (-) Transcript_61172:1305-1925(-)